MSELRRPIGEDPKERRGRGGGGGGFRSARMSAASRAKGLGPGQQQQHACRQTATQVAQVEGSSGSSQKEVAPAGLWLSM
jgi:hypothetical protein